MTTPRRCYQHPRHHYPGCPNCQARSRHRWHNREQNRRAGTWNRALTPIEPVRAHIRHLLAGGMRLQDIAEAAGLTSGRSLGGIAYNRQRTHCIQATADAVLAVEPQPTQRKLIDVIGVQRRIRALMRIGWSQTEVGRLTASDHATVNGWTRNRYVTRFVHDMVRGVYDQVSAQEGSSEYARRWAERRGWPPPEAWSDDTIDDPAAEPYDWCRHDVDDVAVAKVGNGELPFSTLNRAEKTALWQRYGHTAPLAHLQARWRISWKTLQKLRASTPAQQEVA